jgi:hypothetical protein
MDVSGLRSGRFKFWKVPGHPLNSNLGAPVTVRTFCSKVNLLPLYGFELWLFQPVAL